MEITINNDLLSGILNNVGKAVSKKSVLPICQCVLITVPKEKDNIVFRTTNLDISIEKTVPFKCDGSGSVCVDFNRFHLVSKAMKAGDIHIKTEEEKLVLKQKSRRVTLSLNKPDEFPTKQSLDKEKTTRIDTTLEVLNGAVLVSPFTQTMENGITGPLCGVHVFLKNDRIRYEATDGRRMGIQRNKIKNFANAKIKEGTEFDLILLPEHVKIALANLSESEDIQISTDREKVMITGKGVSVFLPHLEGNFPGTDKVIPDEKNLTVLEFNRKSFISAMDFLSMFPGKDGSLISLSVEKDKATMATVGSGSEELTQKIKVKYSGKQIVWGFNPIYLKQGAAVCTDELLWFGITKDQAKPSMMKSGRFKYLVMAVSNDRIPKQKNNNTENNKEEK